MNEVISRAAQLAGKIAHLQARASRFSWGGQARKDTLKELRPLEIEYDLLLEIIKTGVAQ